MCIKNTQHIDFISTDDGPHGQYMALIILDEDRWEGDHNRLLREKIDFYIESVQQNSEPLRRFKKEVSSEHTSPKIEIVCAHEPGASGMEFLNEIGLVLQEHKIAYDLKTFSQMEQSTA